MNDTQRWTPILFVTASGLSAIALLAPPATTTVSQDERQSAPLALSAAARNRFDVMESAFCSGCHPAIYAEHEQSTHGRAFTDAEVRLATARFAHQDCIICHTPRPIFETGVGQNPMRRHYGLHEGITCMSCHWRPEYDYGNFVGGDQCRNAFHSEVGSVEACASCHRNHGTPYQWERSPIGKAKNRKCMDCHMEWVERPVAVGAPMRDVRTHTFPGSRSESQVRRAYRYEAQIEGNVVNVTVTNRGAGHNFPTELKQRSVESLVIVRDAAGEEVARSRMVFRDPYKRPYGLHLPVNTQIPSGESRTHRVPIGVETGTVECQLFFKQYFPIDDYHDDLARLLESRLLPFSGIDPSDEPVESAAEIEAEAPQGLTPEVASVAQLVDFVRPKIDSVEIDVPKGDSPADIQALIELFQFPVPEGNKLARDRLVEIGEPAIPALIDALGSWDNKTYNQSMSVLERLGKRARGAIVAGLGDERLYVRLHSHELVKRLGWRGSDVKDALAAAIDSEPALGRASIAGVVGSLSLQSFGDRLLPMLSDEDPDVVRAASQALAVLQRHDAVPAMESALGAARFDETRRDIALSLALLSSPTGIPTLLEGLNHPDDLIRESFFEAFFAATGMHLGYDPLAPRPRRLDSISRLQSYWAEKGGPRELRAPDTEADPTAEAYAWTLVSKLGGSDYLKPSAEDIDIEEELVAMGKYAVPALIRGLKYPPGFAIKRSAICRALGRIGDRRAAPGLGAALRDPVLRVAAWAAWALEGAGDAASIPALRRYEQRLRTAVRTQTLPADFGPPDQALAQAARTRLLLGDNSARHTLAGLLLSADSFSRRIAFDALGRRFEETYGYDPDADEATRREAAARWME